jgi:hypothetical protein
VLNLLEAMHLRLERLEGAQERTEKAASAADKACAALRATVDGALRSLETRGASFEATLQSASEGVQALRDKLLLVETQQQLADATLREAKTELARIKDVARSVAHEVVREVRAAGEQEAAEAAATPPPPAPQQPQQPQQPQPVAQAPPPQAPPLPSYTPPPAAPPPLQAAAYPSVGAYPHPQTLSPPPFAPPPAYAPTPAPYGGYGSAQPGPYPGDAPSGLAQQLLHSPPPQMEPSYGYPQLPGGQGYGQRAPSYTPQPRQAPPPQREAAPTISNSRVPMEKVVDDLVGMGFARADIRDCIHRLTENGQSVDLNVVIDRLQGRR